jgi:hypothetical protein
MSAPGCYGLRRRLNPMTGEAYWQDVVTDAELHQLADARREVDEAVEHYHALRRLPRPSLFRAPASVRERLE